MMAMSSLSSSVPFHLDRRSPARKRRGNDNARPLHKSSICHSGLDPESRKYLIILDSGFRRNDKIAGFIQLCKGLNAGVFFKLSVIIVHVLIQQPPVSVVELSGS